VIRRFTPGQLSVSDAEALNDLARRLEAVERTGVAAPLTLTDAAGHRVLGVDVPPRLTATITGRLNQFGGAGGGSAGSDAGCLYSWRECVTGVNACDCSALPGGRAGFVDFLPARAIDGGFDVAPGTTVELWLASSRDHYLFARGGGGGGSFAGFDVVLSLVDEDCDQSGLGVPITASPTYQAVQVISNPTVGGAFIAHPSGRTWNGVTDRVFEANGRLVNPGTRAIIYDGGIVTPAEGPSFRQWVFYYNERDPTLWIRIITDQVVESDDGQCRQCFVYLAAAGSLTTNEPLGGVILDKRTCNEFYS
jgi:hypothetical protein